MCNGSIWDDMRKVCDKDRVNGQKLMKIASSVRSVAVEQWLRDGENNSTIHGEKHINAVMRNLHDLTRSLLDTPQELTPEEYVILLSACLVHDIGRNLDVPDACDRHPEYIRRLVEEQEIMVDGKVFTLPISIDDRNMRAAIAKVAEGHWTEYALRLQDKDYVTEYNSTGRPKLLGCLLTLADLLDLSPVRGSYFSGNGRLSVPLETLSQFHHLLRRWIHVYHITPCADGGSMHLVFHLTWNGGNQDVRTMSEWILWWLTSQWRKIKDDIAQLTDSMITWSDPWIQVKFAEKDPADLPSIPDPVRAILQEKYTGQRLTDRNDLRREVMSAFRGKPRQTLIVMPSGQQHGVSQIAQWIESYARTIEGTIVNPTVKYSPTNLRGLNRLIDKVCCGWNVPREHGGGSPLIAIRKFLRSHRDRPVVLIVQMVYYRMNLIHKLLTAFYGPPGEPVKSPRVAVVFVDTSRSGFSRSGDYCNSLRLAAKLPKDIVCYLPKEIQNKVKVILPNAAISSQRDLAGHLNTICGLSSAEAQNTVRELWKMWNPRYQSYLFDFHIRKMMHDSWKTG